MSQQYKWSLCGFVYGLIQNQKASCHKLVLVKRIGLHLALLCVRLMSSHSLTLSTFTAAITVSLADKRTRGSQKVGPWLLTTWERDMCSCMYVCVCVYMCCWITSAKTALAGQAFCLWLCVLMPYLETENKKVHISERWRNLSALQLCSSSPGSHNSQERLIFPSYWSSFSR